MKLVIFNGSPRNKKSNSKILIEHFLNGYSRFCPEPVPVHYLADRKDQEEQTEAFRNAEMVILIFPLYTDCMPGIVKEFFEHIAAIKRTSSKKMGFMVQSGFPEAVHSISIERYLEKLAGRLQCEYLGTIIKGGVEGIQVMPHAMTRKLFGSFEDLGEYFAKNEAFSAKIMEKLRKPFKMPFIKRFFFSMINKTGVTNFYWNSNLKKNNAFEKRFDRPYEAFSPFCEQLDDAV